MKNLNQDITDINEQLNQDISTTKRLVLQQELYSKVYKHDFHKQSAVAVLYQSWESGNMIKQLNNIKEKYFKKNEQLKSVIILHDALYIHDSIDIKINDLIIKEKTGEFDIPYEI